MWFVYIIECENKSLYTGCTNDLNRRFQEHKLGTGARYTSLHKPIKILFSQECGTRSNALKKEYQIKGWPHDKKIKFIQSQNKPG